jgi:hypothetical protein
MHEKAAHSFGVAFGEHVERIVLEVFNGIMRGSRSIPYREDRATPALLSEPA